MLFSLPFSAHGEQKLLFVTVNNFPPYAWQENGKPTGIDIEIIQALAKHTGKSISIEQMPAKRVILMIQNGSADGGFAAFKNPSRLKMAHFIDPPIHLSTYQIFVRTGEDFSFNKIQDLSGKVIGKNRGFHISEEFSKASKDKLFEIVEVSAMKQNISMLEKGRLDAFIGNQHEVSYMLKQLGLLEKIVPLSNPIRTPQSAHLMISRSAKITDKEKTIKQLSNALQKMKENGTFDSIYEKYGN